MKNIPELPGCGHMGADFLRITSHGHSLAPKIASRGTWNLSET